MVAYFSCRGSNVSAYVRCRAGPITSLEPLVMPSLRDRTNQSLDVRN